jgi:hypothetical protein
MGSTDRSDIRVVVDTGDHYSVKLEMAGDYDISITQGDNYHVIVETPTTIVENVNLYFRIADLALTAISASFAQTASYTLLENVDGFSSYSSSIDNRLDNLENFSSSLDATFATDEELFITASLLQNSIDQKLSTASFVDFSSSYTTGSFTGSFVGDGSQLTGLVTDLRISGSTGSDVVSLLTDDLLITGSNGVTVIVTDNVVTIGLPDGVVSSSVQINTGSFTGSFIGDGSQLTGLVTDLRISGSTGSDVVSLLTDDLTFSGSNGVTTVITDNTVTIGIPAGTVSSSTQAVSWSVATASYVDFENIDNLPTLVSSSAQINTGSFTGSFIGDGSQLTGLVTDLRISGSTGSDVVSLLSDDLTFSGSNGITTTVTDNTVTINLPSGVVSGAAQVKELLPSGTVSSSTQATEWSVLTASYAANADLLDGLDSTQFALTSSNTFTGIQSITDTTNSTLWNDGALVVDGGVGIGKDVWISGSLNVVGLLTAISMSTQYVTSSQYTIGTSRVIVNDDDLVRFAGLSVIDSGSTPASASLLWDSLNNHFIIETDDIHDNTVDIHSAVVITGPETIEDVGNEIGLIPGRVPVATTDHNISTEPSDSPLRIVSGTFHVENDLFVTGSINAASITSSFTGSFIGDGSQLTGLVTDLRISGSTGSDVVSLLTDDLVITGSNGVTTTVTDNTVTISIPTGTVSSSAQINTGSFTGSFIGDGSQLTGLVTDLRISGSTGSDVVSLLTDDLLITGSNGVTTTVTDNTVTISIPDGTVSSSAQAVSWSVATASYAVNAETLDGLDSTVFATTGSNVFYGNQTINGSLLLTDVSSSINIFGTELTDEHQFTGSVSITGSLNADNITGSLFGTSSYASTASYVEYDDIANLPALVSSSAQVTELLPAGTVSSSTQATTWTVATASYVDYANVANLPTLVSSSAQINTGSFSGSFIGDGSQLSGIATDLRISGSTGSDTVSLTTDDLIFSGSNGVTTVVTDSTVTIGIPSGVVSSSTQAADWTVASASVSVTASYALAGGTPIDTSSFATTGSNIFSGSQTINGQLVVIDLITSSANIFGDDYGDQHIFSGSLIVDGTMQLFSAGAATNVFGDSASDNHIFTGSVNIDGPLTATSKSFKIIHPTKAGKFLIYGSLEAPYHGVRLTGEGELSGNTTKIYLPDYISGLCNQEGSQVQITNIKHDKVLWIEDIVVNENYFTVSCNRRFFDNKSYKFYWSFTATRKDVEDLQVEVDF